MMGTARKLVVSVSLVIFLVLSVKICTVEMNVSLPPTTSYMKWNQEITASPHQNKSQSEFRHSSMKYTQQNQIRETNFGEPRSLSLKNACSDAMCTGYLKPFSLKKFRDCTRRHWSEKENGTCRFMNGTSRRKVALASFPGSGSTWVRGLLEKATGICTGSVYCDASLRTVGFNGEGVASSAVLAVKTHESIKQFKRAIHIVRCPADAMVSEWNRKHGITRGESKHTAHALPQAFGSNRNWSEFIVEWSRRWGQAALRLAKYRQSRPLLRIFYEDLKTNATGEVLRMLDFLEVPHSKETVEERLSQGYHKFHRLAAGPRAKHYFTNQQRSILSDMLSRLHKECTKKGYSETKQYIQKYLSCI